MTHTDESATTPSEYESTSDTDAIARFLNARAKHIRAQQQANGRPGDERLFYREQSMRLDALHARRELARRIKMHAWNEGHDAACPVRAQECGDHTNPYVLAGRGTGHD